MRSADFPAVDDRAVEPETGTEMIDGQVLEVLPAEPPHADEQCNIAYVIRSDVAPGYIASTELLTRVNTESDFATDACIRRVGRDPRTKSRYLEEISFEVKHKQSSADIKNRARQLIQRGVRRVFVIHVREDEDSESGLKAGPIQEWLPGEDNWLELHPDFEITDPCLITPVKVQALIEAAEANNQVARALLAQDNPEIVKDRQRALDALREQLEAAHAEVLEARDAEHAREIQERIDELEAAHTRALEARDAEYARAMEARDAEYARAMEARERAIEEAHTRAVIVDLCEVLGIELTPERRARMAVMGRDELDDLRGTIRTERRWPDERV